VFSLDANAGRSREAFSGARASVLALAGRLKAARPLWCLPSRIDGVEPAYTKAMATPIAVRREQTT
jgi:hypothetical protein